MLRSLFVDPIRLLARRAWMRWGCRLLLFMAMPTRREMREMVRKALDTAVAEAFPHLAFKHDDKHQTLH